MQAILLSVSPGGCEREGFLGSTAIIVKFIPSLSFIPFLLLYHYLLFKGAFDVEMVQVVIVYETVRKTA